MSNATNTDHLRSLGFTAYQLPSLHEIEAAGWVSKNDVARVLYPNQTCDSALPQDWVNYAAEYCVDVRPGWVMLYDPNLVRAIMGYPMPLYQEALVELRESDSIGLQHVAVQAREILGDLLGRQSLPEEDTGTRSSV